MTARLADIGGFAGCDRAELAGAVEEFFARAREARPGDWIEPPALAERLGELLGESPDPLGELGALRAGDLVVAAAALAGHHQACAELEAEIHGIAAAVVGRMGGGPGEADETAREVVEKIVAGSADRAPRIADYRGRGSLGGWLRATVSRTYLNRMRSRKREVLIGDQGVLDALDDQRADPALAHLKALYRAEFAEAFEAAIGTLTHRQRAVLRYRFVDGATVETVAAVFRVHRSTCHRWIVEARAALAAATERRLRSKLSLSESDFEQVRQLVESQLELSLSRIFATKS